MTTESDINAYMRGACHIHAIAAVQQHGGRFAIAYDDSETYYEGEDGDEVSAVLHVWSLHETPDGLVARDVRGEVPATPEAMRESLCAFFPELEEKFHWNDARICLQNAEDDVRELSGNRDYQPLAPVLKRDIKRAARIPSVIAAPGTLPAPQRPEDAGYDF